MGSLRRARDELRGSSSYTDEREVLGRSLDAACRRRLQGRSRFVVSPSPVGFGALRDESYEIQIAYFFHTWEGFQLSMPALARVHGTTERRIAILLGLAFAAEQNLRRSPTPHALNTKHHFIYRLSGTGHCFVRPDRLAPGTDRCRSTGPRSANSSPASRPRDVVQIELDTSDWLDRKGRCMTPLPHPTATLS